MILKADSWTKRLWRSKTLCTSADRKENKSYSVDTSTDSCIYLTRVVRHYLKITSIWIPMQSSSRQTTMTNCLFWRAMVMSLYSKLLISNRFKNLFCHPISTLINIDSDNYPFKYSKNKINNNWHNMSWSMIVY